MRARLFNWAAIGRAAALVLAVVLALIVIAATLRSAMAGASRALGGEAAAADPLAPDLARCQSAATSGDGLCQAVWAASRRRFFTYGAAPALTAKDH